MTIDLDTTPEREPEPSPEHTRNVRRGLAVLSVAVVASALALADTSPAMAAPNCQSGQACAFQHANFSGLIDSHSTRGVCIYVGDDMNDRASSLSNSSPRRAVWWEHANCTGKWIGRAAGYSTDNLWGTGYNDIISAVRIDP